MSKIKKMRKLILTVLTTAVLMCMVLFAGCSTSSGEDENGEVTGTCTITIQGVCESQEMDIHEGDTVLDILQAVDTPIATENTGNGISIEAINGKANEQEKGWVFYVNGEMPMDYSDRIQVNDGDIIDWEYSDGM